MFRKDMNSLLEIWSFAVEYHFSKVGDAQYSLFHFCRFVASYAMQGSNMDLF